MVTVDSAGVAKENNSSFSVDTSVAKDTIKPFKRFKAEGVASVIGEYVIVEFDIDLSYIELKEQGVAIDEISRCQMLGKLMEDKLYAHHAKLDSLLVPDAEINGRIDQQIQYMVSELGSEEKVAEYYRKESISELRQQLFEVNKTLALATEMQQKITEEVEITPEEVREFFYKIPEDERPIFGAEVEVSQIVIEPQVTKKAEQEVIDRLNEIRAEVVEGGASFATRAVLYSKDGSASKGGLILVLKEILPTLRNLRTWPFRYWRVR